MRNLLPIALLAFLPAAAQPPRTDSRPLPQRTQNASAPSHVYKRGDVEILTYESEESCNRLQELYRNQNSPPTPGEMTARYYLASTDGSVQPYAVRLPNGFSGGHRYPLVIQLHGLNFKEVLFGSRVMYRGMAGPMWIQPDLPVIYGQCFGRPSTFYYGMGEMDVLDVIAEMKRRFPVDPDRVFIMGHSMGGAGSYTVGLHHPDMFGGIMPIDPALWIRPDEMPKWMEPQAAIMSVPKLYPNARNVDVFFKNAGAGIQKNSTEFNDGIVAEGGFSTSESFPGKPHNFGDEYPYANFVTELIQHPIRHNPAEVKFYTNTLRYNSAYWVTIDRLKRHNADARVVATNKEGAIRITTTNIDALTLKLGAISAALAVDGQEVTKRAARSGPRLQAKRPVEAGRMEFERVGEAPRPAGAGGRRVQLAVPGRLWRRRPGSRYRGIGRHPQPARPSRHSRRIPYEGGRQSDARGCRILEFDPFRNAREQRGAEAHCGIVAVGPGAARLDFRLPEPGESVAVRSGLERQTAQCAG